MKAFLSTPTIAPSPNAGFIRNSVKIKFGGGEKVLWFETQEANANYLTSGRMDAFLVALLPWAIGNQLDLVCEAPVSDELLFRLKDYFLPFYSVFKKKGNISIEAKGIDALSPQGGVGVGLSCGVDSMATIAQYYYRDVDAKHKITHLCFFDAGSSSTRSGESIIDSDSNRPLIEERYQNAVECAAMIGLPLIYLKTNIPEFNSEGDTFEDLSQICHVSCALQLGNLFSVFYVSSAYQTIFEYYENPVGVHEHMETYESTFLPYLCTGSLTLHLSCHMLFRLDKLKLLCDIPAAQKHLNVCIRRGRNCSICMKCIRTLLPLDIIGKLDNFKEVFDLKKYRKRRLRIWADSYATRGTDKFMRMLWEYIDRNHIEVPFGTKILSVFLRIKHAWRHFRKAIFSKKRRE